MRTKPWRRGRSSRWWSTTDENQVIDNSEEVYRWLEVFLSYSAGGVVLKPVTLAGSEKIVTFCIDVQ
jgi:hypothetical protein